MLLKSLVSALAIISSAGPATATATATAPDVTSSLTTWMSSLVWGSGERDALMALFEGTDGPSWTNKDGWGSSQSICKWYGVACSWFGFGSVNRLELIDNNLHGELPPELHKLGGLEYIDLSLNFFSGQLPPSYGEWSKMETLRINNRFEGEDSLNGSIPDEWKGMRKLWQLFLVGHSLTGEIPEWIGDLPKLGELALAGNEFVGELPSSLRRSKINNFVMGGNKFTGTLPQWLGEMSELETLSLDDNEFHGSIPDVFTNSKVAQVRLGRNKLEGEIPKSFCRDTLTDLDLSETKISGQVPECLRNTKVNFLWLGDTEITDQIHPGSEMDAWLSSIEYCNLSRTHIKCPVSDVLTDHCTVECEE